MGDRDGVDWRRSYTRRLPPDSYADDVESEEDYDNYGDEEDEEEDYDDHEDDYNDGDNVAAKTGLACPFCLEEFDALGLFCHIDLDHHREAKAAICPVCVTKVPTNIVAHLITQHETILKMLCKKKNRKGGSCSALSILKKESRDERFHSPIKGSSSVESRSNMENDALLLSFIYNRQKPETTRPSPEASSLSSNSDIDIVESGRDTKTCTLPNKDQERVQRCEFVQGLLLSTIFSEEL